jgi:Cys-rich protein (TIGR01571 family)
VAPQPEQQEQTTTTSTQEQPGEPKVTVIETPAGTVTTTVEKKEQAAPAQQQPRQKTSMNLDDVFEIDDAPPQRAETRTGTSTDSAPPPLPEKAPTRQPTRAPTDPPPPPGKAPTFQPPPKQPTTVVTGDVPPAPLRATVESGTSGTSVSSIETTPKPAASQEVQNVPRSSATSASSPKPTAPKKAKTVQQPEPPLVTVHLDESIAPQAAVRVNHGTSSSDWGVPPVRMSVDLEKGHKKHHHRHSKHAAHHDHNRHGNHYEEGDPWQSSILGCFDDCGDCLVGWCCPCILYGKTDHRMKRSPTLEGYSVFNTPCLVSCLVISCTGCFGEGIVAFLQRREVRKHYNLKGDTLTDVAFGCLLPCCAQIQNENEAKRQTAAGKTEQYSQRGAVMRYGTSSTS